MCLKNKEKLVEKLKKSKIYLTYFNLIHVMKIK